MTNRYVHVVLIVSDKMSDEEVRGMLIGYIHEGVQIPDEMAKCIESIGLATDGQPELTD